MSIPNMQIVLRQIRDKYNCTLTNIKGERIMFKRGSDNKKLVFCTPYSKLYPQGNESKFCYT